VNEIGYLRFCTETVREDKFQTIVMGDFWGVSHSKSQILPHTTLWRRVRCSVGSKLNPIALGAFL
jgi:hypothetical protein